MSIRQRIPFWLPLAGVFALGLGTLLAIPAPAVAEEISVKQQISDIEKQIADLQKKLDDLRKQTSALPTSPNQPEDLLPEAWVKGLNWRSIGPATMGGRIVDLSIFEADPSTFWVATASGGLLKTVNNGVTFEHQFDRETTVSVGAVAVAPSNRDIVWVGTGENNPRNSVSYGDGVYKSTDGGKTWKNMGLKKTYQIGEIVIDPKNPDIVYVGALGRLYGPSEERGVYKTTDGGKTWTRSLYIDNKTGIIDLRIHPSDPNTLVAAAWERLRDEFDSHPGQEPIKDGYDGYDPIKKWGAAGGLFKSTDGGKTWKKLTKGLPTNATGRIGLDWYVKNPNVLFAIIDCEKIGMGTAPSTAYLGLQGEDATGGPKLTSITEGSPAEKAGLKAGDILVSIDKKPIKNYNELVALMQTKKPGDKLEVVVKRDKETKTIVVELIRRPGSEQAGGRVAPRVFVGLAGEEIKDGLKITSVTEGGPAEKAGLKADDVILTLEKKAVKTLEELIQQTAEKNPGDKLTLSIQRGQEKKDVVVTLAERPRRGGAGAGGGTPPTRPWGAMYGGQRENVQDQQGPGSEEFGGIYRSDDGGESWKRINSLNPRPMYFSVVRVDPMNDQYVYVLGVSLYRSNDGGKTFTADGGRTIHPDQHSLWINPKDGRHMIIGTDGGTYVTYDRMDHWDFLNHAAVGQFYHVAVDNKMPYRVYGGMQDNGSWGGPSRSLSGGILNEDWVVVGGGDGFVCRIDPDDPDLVYFESQGGAIQRRNLRTGERGSIQPRSPRGQPGYRFNWNTPFILSAHNPRIVYSGGEYVFRSINRGADAKQISPEITRTKRGSATAIAESPRTADVIWAGTDDGFLWVTKDGGKNWANVTANLHKAGVPGPRWVSTIEASRYVDGRAYVVLDAHRSDDDEPYVFATEDFGETWKSLRANLPWGSTRVLREDIENQNLLYLGTEFGAWASINRGKSWTKINNNLPTVAVHEIAIHPKAGEIVAATHGRSLWVLDVSALRQIKPSMLEAKVTLFKPHPVVRWRSEPARGSAYGNGNRRYVGDDGPRGAQIYFALSKKPEKINLKVVDFANKTVRTLEVKAEAGLQRVGWDTTRLSAGPATGAFGGFGGGGGRAFSEPVEAGTYRVLLTVDGEEMSVPIQVNPDPAVPSAIAEEQSETRKRRPDGRLDD